MCGFTGVYRLDGTEVPVDLVRAMNATLIHRGPDDQGLTAIRTDTGRSFRAGDAAGCNLVLAGRRLSIIDLSPAGRMPMSSQNETIWLVYNGEIYNYRELRTELESLGHIFRSGTDTEVIIEAYAEWGTECLDRFNGMWAFALYDCLKRRLFCSRDRFGIKPFYFSFDGTAFVFGSEIKSILAHPGLTFQPNPQAMFNYLARSYRFVDGRPTTFFQGIQQIEPGCSLLVDENGIEIFNYWRLHPDDIVEPGYTEDQYVSRYLELLEDSVRLRLRSDVAVAAQLSGGLDSSAVAALAARRLGHGLPVFSACYDEKPFDERDFIDPTVRLINAGFTPIFPRPDGLLEELPRMIRAFDEPICTVTFFAHWQVMAEVHRQGFKVILNGHGADELAAGYYDHFLHHFGDLRQQGANGLLDAEVQSWLANHGQERSGHLKEYFRLLDLGRPYMEDYLKHFRPYENALGPALKSIKVEPKPNQDIFETLLTNRLYNELRHETLPAVLKAEDRVSMAFSIESRLPFLDYRLVEFMFSVPNALKIKKGLGKYIQRQALTGVIPEMVRTRHEKVGFNAPSETWFRTHLGQSFENILHDSGLFDMGLLDRAGFSQLWEEHRSGNANHYQYLWQVLNLDIWLREYFA